MDEWTEDGYWWNATGNNTPGGCCSWDYVTNSCVFKGGNIIQQCISRCNEYVAQDFCVDNCQDPAWLANEANFPTSIPRYNTGYDNGQTSGTTGWSLYYGTTLCIPDNDSDGICDLFDDCVGFWSKIFKT